MVHDVLYSIWSEGFVKGDGDKVVVVADHLRDVPFRAVKRPDTKRPPVQLRVAKDIFVDVHDSAPKGIDTLVNLTVCLPGVSTVLLCFWVVDTGTQQLLVAEPSECYPRVE
jgi:hypothetical protein